MRKLSNIHLSDVQTVYSGPEGDLWELIMGEQIHIGGLESSLDLAEHAGIKPGMSGVDMCCCTGAGMRFLLKMRQVARMCGVDATSSVIERGKARNAKAGLSGQIKYVQADVCNSGLPSNSADFVWGEDAWCYVENKQLLAAEAARIVKPGGQVAFTDWIEGEKAMSSAEAERFLKFMKFPTFEDLSGWSHSLTAADLKVLHAKNTGRFEPYVNLYIDMLNKQFTFDALRIIGFDQDLLGMLAGELEFTRQLARAGKLAQGLFVAVKK
jgi:SAM-dependent methyltransferase